MDFKRPKIYCDAVSKNVLSILAQLDAELVPHPDQANILWCRNHYNRFFKTLTAEQYINHFPSESCLVNKSKLVASLRAYGQRQPTGALLVDEFLQPSYRLSDKQEREEFLAQLPTQDTVENLWILKPANLSQGNGIKVIWDFANFKEQLQTNNGKLTVENYGLQDYIIQKYIQNPLLLEGRKSEVRLYWLLASVEPLIVLMFHEGTVRLNTLPFKLDEFENQLIHVTNVHQQKQHPDYDPHAILKWSFADLQAYLLENNHTLDQNYLNKYFMPRCCDIIRTVVAANIETLRKNAFHGQHFGLYGADIILDDALNPWLTEIQKSPGLSYSDAIKQQVIPPMIGETFNIINEIRQRKLNNQRLQHLDSVTHFQWVVNEAE